MKKYLLLLFTTPLILAFMFSPNITHASSGFAKLTVGAVRLAMDGSYYSMSGVNFKVYNEKPSGYNWWLNGSGCKHCNDQGVINVNNYATQGSITKTTTSKATMPGNWGMSMNPYQFSCGTSGASCNVDKGTCNPFSIAIKLDNPSARDGVWYYYVRQSSDPGSRPRGSAEHDDAGRQINVSNSGTVNLTMDVTNGSTRYLRVNFRDATPPPPNYHNLTTQASVSPASGLPNQTNFTFTGSDIHSPEDASSDTLNTDFYTWRWYVNEGSGYTNAALSGNGEIADLPKTFSTEGTKKATIRVCHRDSVSIAWPPECNDSDINADNITSSDKDLITQVLVAQSEISVTVGRPTTTLGCKVEPQKGLAPLVVKITALGGTPPYNFQVEPIVTLTGRTSPVYYTYGSSGEKEIIISDSSSPTPLTCTVDITVDPPSSGSGGEVAP